MNLDRRKLKRLHSRRARSLTLWRRKSEALTNLLARWTQLERSGNAMHWAHTSHAKLHVDTAAKTC
jgi:hypothetical protein